MKLEKRSGVYYVAKNQEIFGPISTSELEGMKKSGELSNYTWLCMEGESSWRAIDPAPKTLPFAVVAEVPASPRRFQVQNTRIDTGKSESYRGILFDSRNAVTAWVSQASDSGCEIRADGENSDPLFVKKAGAVLNLYEVATGKTSNVTVHVDEILRVDRRWIYKVRWSHVPALFEGHKAS